MPLYHQIIVALPRYPKEGLVNMFRKHSKLVMSAGGVVRGIENHGVRPLPERATRKYATTEGKRHFWEARYVSTCFDASPTALVEIDRLLRNEEGVLRYFTVKKETALNRAKGLTYRNVFRIDPKASQVTRPQPHSSSTSRSS